MMNLPHELGKMVILQGFALNFSTFPNILPEKNEQKKR